MGFVSKDRPPEGYSIVSVFTDRSYPEGHEKAGERISHACVALDGILVHDPYTGYVGDYEIKYYFTIGVLDDEDD